MACAHRRFVVHRMGADHKWDGINEHRCACRPAVVCPVCQPDGLASCVITSAPPLVDALIAHTLALKDGRLN